MEALIPLSSSAVSLVSPRISSQPRRLRRVSALRGDSGDDKGDVFFRPQRGGAGKVVDEGMVVLRKRIHEMKMVERNYEPPSEWMDWEKQYYTCYDSMVCDLVGALQSCLMESRPTVVLGVAALLMVSVPTSSVVVVFHFMEIARSILSGVHLI